MGYKRFYAVISVICLSVISQRALCMEAPDDAHFRQVLKKFCSQTLSQWPFAPYWSFPARRKKSQSLMWDPLMAQTTIYETSNHFLYVPTFDKLLPSQIPEQARSFLTANESLFEAKNFADQSRVIDLEFRLNETSLNKTYRAMLYLTPKEIVVALRGMDGTELNTLWRILNDQRAQFAFVKQRKSFDPFTLDYVYLARLFEKLSSLGWQVASQGHAIEIHR